MTKVSSARVRQSILPFGKSVGKLDVGYLKERREGRNSQLAGAGVERLRCYRGNNVNE